MLGKRKPSGTTSKPLQLFRPFRLSFSPPTPLFLLQFRSELGGAKAVYENVCRHTFHSSKTIYLSLPRAVEAGWHPVLTPQNFPIRVVGVLRSLSTLATPWRFSVSFSCSRTVQSKLYGSKVNIISFVCR